jgi:sugar/nucleoside kinase (ribokinase family)
MVLVDATDLSASIAIARAARAIGVPTVVDVDRIEADTADLLAAVEILVAPEEFVKAFTRLADTGAGLRALARQFESTAVIATCGERGSVAWAGGREIVTSGFAVPVADTTGAGDAFRAGLCAGWLRQRGHAGAGSPDLVQILEWATATAALNGRAVGAQTGLPTEAEVAALVTHGRPRRSKG